MVGAIRDRLEKSKSISLRNGGVKSKLDGGNGFPKVRGGKLKHGKAWESDRLLSISVAEKTDGAA